MIIIQLLDNYKLNSSYSNLMSQINNSITISQKTEDADIHNHHGKFKPRNQSVKTRVPFENNFEMIM